MRTNSLARRLARSRFLSRLLPIQHQLMLPDLRWARRPANIQPLRHLLVRPVRRLASGFTWPQLRSSWLSQRRLSPSLRRPVFVLRPASC